MEEVFMAKSEGEKPIACIKCGECCKWLPFILPQVKTDRILRDYYIKHGCLIKDNWVIVPSRCQNLTKDNLCAIYEKRPYLCKAYCGQDRYYIPPTCAFSKNNK